MSKPLTVIPASGRLSFKIGGRLIIMKVADLTVEELKTLIGETVEEKLREYLDHDYGLELSPEAEEALRESIEQKKRGEGIPLEEAKKRLGLG